MNGFRALWTAKSGSDGSDEEPTTTKFADKVISAVAAPKPARPNGLVSAMSR